MSALDSLAGRSSQVTAGKVYNFLIVCVWRGFNSLFIGLCYHVWMVEKGGFEPSRPFIHGRSAV